MLLWFLERPENLVPILKLHQNIFGLLSICQYEETVGLSQEVWRFAAGVGSMASLTCHIFHGRFLRHCTKLSSVACRFLALQHCVGDMVVLLCAFLKTLGASSMFSALTKADGVPREAIRKLSIGSSLSNSQQPAKMQHRQRCASRGYLELFGFSLWFMNMEDLP